MRLQEAKQRARLLKDLEEASQRVSQCITELHHKYGDVLLYKVYRWEHTRGNAWRGGVVQDGDTAYYVCDLHNRVYESFQHMCRVGHIWRRCTETTQKCYTGCNKSDAMTFCTLLHSNWQSSDL